MFRVFVLAGCFRLFWSACMCVRSKRTVIDVCLSNGGELKLASFFIHATYGLSLLQIQFNQHEKHYGLNIEIFVEKNL